MFKKFIKLIKKIDPVDLFFKGIKVATVIGAGVILAMGIKSKFGNAEKVADSKTRSPNTEKPKSKATETTKTTSTEVANTETKSVSKTRDIRTFKNTLSRFADFAQSTISFIEATRYIFKNDDENYRPYRPYNANNFMGYNGGNPGFNQGGNLYSNFGGSTCNRSTFISPIPNSIHRSGPLKDNEKRFLPLSELKTRPRIYTDCEINNPAGYLNVGETYRKYNIDGSYVDITRLSSNSNGISYESYNVDHTIA